MLHTLPLLIEKFLGKNVHLLKSHLYVLLATFLVAGSFLVSAKLSGIIHPFSLTLLRFLYAALILLPIVISKKKWRNRIFLTLPRASVMSLFYSVFFICLFESLKTTTSLNTGTLYTLVPFVTAFLCLFFFKQPISLKQLTVYILGAVGTGWVVFSGRIDLLLSFSLNKGDLIFIIGALSMCCYSISTKLLYRNDPMVVLVFCNFVSGSIWMTLALIVSGQPLEWNLIQGQSFYNMVYLVFCATLATVYLYQKATISLGPSKVMAYTYLNPAAVAVLLLIIDNVSIEISVIPGILLSSIATVILQLNHK
ncbi:MAG: DMT family transporter [Xenococcaceae cyanobacterium MO_207.B15]|nr:DMT family transporter [Xenococcaceae cyanobacterium MO_207.B15]MDJ0745099.1 DMT family transporter [Xenococcaceae cyanobacterium MO_167.B27]